MSRIRLKWYLAVLVPILGTLILVAPKAFHQLQARSHLGEGVKAYASHNYELAERNFLAATRLDPGLVEAHVALMSLYIPQETMAMSREDRERGFQREENLANNVLAADPKNLKAFEFVVEYCLFTQLHQEAERWYRKWAAVHPDDSRPLLGLATLIWQRAYDKSDRLPITSREESELQKRVEEGIALLERAIRLDPACLSAYQYQSLLYVERAKLTSDIDKRRGWLRKADLCALQAARVSRAR